MLRTNESQRYFLHSDNIITIFFIIFVVVIALRTTEQIENQSIR